MTAIIDLSTLLKSMRPVADQHDYAFCTVESSDCCDYAKLSPFACIREDEGLTLVVKKSAADRAGLPVNSIFRRITLSVHSSLDAVGLTAAVATRLTEANISANVIAAFYHDHIFVPSEKFDIAMEALRELEKKFD